MSRFAAIVAMAAAIGLLGACGGTGVHAQDPSASRPSSSSVSASPTPNTGFGDAQPAVDAYLAATASYYTASRNPTTANQTNAEKTLRGQALTVIENDLSRWQRTGITWVGTPPTPQLAVDDDSQLHSPLPTVRLSSCVVSSAEGWHAVQHGQTLPSPTRTTTGPVYARTATMVEMHGQWNLILLDTSKIRTCPS